MDPWFHLRPVVCQVSRWTRKHSKKSPDSHTTWSNDFLNLDEGHINLLGKFPNGFIGIFIGWRINVILHSESCSGGNSPKHHQAQTLRHTDVNECWKETGPCHLLLKHAYLVHRYTAAGGLCMESLAFYCRIQRKGKSKHTQESLIRCWGRLLSVRLRESFRLGVENGC